MNPPDNAAVLSVDEKPSIQALGRVQDYLKLPNGRWNGTTTLFAALDVLTAHLRDSITNAADGWSFWTS